jgi:branched-chain amino acid transport system substrate-binding protein
MSRYSRRSTVGIAAGCLTLAMTVAACGDDSAAGGEGLPDTITIKEIADISGASSYLGTQADRGLKLALKEINDSGFLGETTLEVDVTDTASNQQTAAQEAGKAAAGDFPVVILNGITNTAAAATPLLQRQKIPTIAPICGPEATEGNSLVYNLATPVVELQGLSAEYAQAQGATKLGSIYDSGISTFADIAEDVYPEIAGDYGIEVVESAAITSSTVDVASAVNKVIDAGADVIFVGTLGAQAVTITQEARRAGFDGTFLSTAGVGGGVLAPAGEDAVGVTWSNEYSSSTPESADFAKAYMAAYDGEVPIQVAANSYDATWLAARAIKEANSIDREAVAEAMAELAEQPLEGSPRGEVEIRDNQAYATGVLLQWDGKGEVLIPSE